MPVPRRPPDVIALEILDCIDQKKGKASRWDLIKILGNEAQFRQWIGNFLVKDKFVEEMHESRRYYYRKTKNGDLLHELLRNGKMVKALLRVSGKRLRNRY